MIKIRYEVVRSGMSPDNRHELIQLYRLSKHMLAFNQENKRNTSIHTYVRRIISNTRSNYKSLLRDISRVEKAYYVSYNRNGLSFQDYASTKAGALNVIQDIKRRIQFDRDQRRRLTPALYVPAIGEYIYRDHVFPRPNMILDIIRRRKLTNIFENKKTLNDDRHTGIEIEFYSEESRETIAQKLMDSGLEKYVSLKGDGSLRPREDERGHELCIVAPNSDLPAVLKKSLEAINSNTVRVDKACGLHVHLDMRKEDKDKAFNNLVKSQKLLYSMVPKSRRENSFCKKTTKSDMSYYLYGRGSGRYKAINPFSYRKHGTIEVRLHSGTTDFSKIFNWVAVLWKIVDADKIERAPRTLDSLKEKLKLGSVLSEYVNERVNKFSEYTGSNESSYDLSEDAA